MTSFGVLFLLDFVYRYSCTKFCCSRLTNKWIKQGDGWIPPTPGLLEPSRNLAVNASAFSFVSCFKAIDYAGASNYVISAN